MKNNVGSVSMDLILNDSKFKSGITSSSKMAQNAFSSSMKKIGTAIASAFAVKKIIDFGTEAVKAATKIQSAWTGLNSIVEGTGNSFGVAQKFINEFTKDGLMSIEETATAYKNLLSRGYDATQIEKTLTALKDSAAFGRQASYDLGEAVVTATEGLKNENSILVDNAGVTKNVAKMWEEWAKAHNTTTQAMTQSQKIEAEYNDILKETKFQTGDAATYTKTFGGLVQMLKMSFTNLKVAVGKVVAPIAQLFIPVINSALVAVTNFFNGIQKVLKVFGVSFPDVVSKSSAGLTSVGSLASQAAKDIDDTGNSAVKAAKKINKAFGSVDEINVISTKDKSSSGNASSSSTGVEIAPQIASDSAVSDAVSGTIDKIMKYIEPLKNIKFDGIVNGFNEIKEALAPITDTIGKGLEWLYFNILVPFAKWTIEDAVPAFLHAIAGALQFLSPILDGAMTGLKWLWENFLKPIASWTGGVIVDVLQAIGDVLSWIAQNETGVAILKTLGIVLGVIAGALAAVNIALGVFTTLMTIITSPITLVIAAVTALIAVIILLVKSWDKIKEVAINVWNKIKEIWAAVANWFNDNVIQPIISFFSPLIDFYVKLFTEIWNFIKSVFEVIIQLAQGCVNTIKIIWSIIADWFNKTIIQPIKDLFGPMWNGLVDGAKNAWEGIKSVFSTVATFFDNTFTKALEKVKKVFSTGGKIFDGIKDGIVNGFKTIVNGIIGGINKVVSTPFNGINKVLKKIRDVDIAGAHPFKKLVSTIDVPEIPKLAQGGYVSARNPQLAIIGDNTREGEIVAPESKIYDQTYKAVKDAIGNGGKQELAITIYHKYEDGKTIIQKINQAQIDAGEILVLT